MATNLWPNADLESGIDDWNAIGDGISHSSAEAWEQTYSLLVDVDSGNYSGAESDYKAVIEPSTQYTLTAYSLSAGADNNLRMVVFGDDSGNLGANNQTANSSTWVRFQVVFTTSVAETEIKFRITKNNHAGTVNFYTDAVMLETGDTPSTWENYSAGGQVDLTATIAAVTTTSAASLAVTRPLTATVAAVTTTGTPTLDTSINLTATIAAATSTGTAALNVARALTAATAAVTTTSTPSLAVVRPLTATVAAVTTTGTPTLGLSVPLTATIAAEVSTGGPVDGWEVGAYIYEHALGPSLAVDRPLTAAIAAVTTTGTPSLAVTRPLTATVAAVTTLSLIHI